jgi:hypothetical protein
MKLGHKGHLNTRNKFPKRFSPNSKIFLLILDELKKPKFLGESREIYQIERDRVMDSLQGWRWMMRLILAPKPIEGIEEKLLKSGQQYLRKS